MHRTAGYILGVDPDDIPPRVDLSAPRQIKENGLERNITEITVGKTRKTYYEINRRETKNRIAEVAEEEEDRLDKYGDLPF